MAGDNVEKIFVLGVGAQKAGTSWLYETLNQLPFADFGLLKEYHVFDTLTFPNPRQKAYLLDPQRSYWRRLPPIMFSSTNPMKLRRTFINNTDLYFDYFQRLVGWRRPGVHLTGDITPAYSSLSAETLRDIRHQLIRRGFKVKIVFLMRDPVERLWSAIRMDRRFKIAENPFLDFDLSEDDAILKAIKNKHVDGHARYEVTLDAIKKAFPAEDAFIGLYETFFNAKSWQALCQTLEIDAPTPSFDHFVNRSPKSDNLVDETQQMVANHYRQSYYVACERFGQKIINELWPSANLIR